MQLPLWAYLLVSALAIAALAFMVRRLRPGAPPPMTADIALKTFREDFPNSGAHAAELSADGQTAMISSSDGRLLGFVTLLGLRWTTRLIEPRDIASVATEGARTTVRLNDFTWPSITVRWRDSGQAQHWAARIAAAQDVRHA